MHSTYLKKLMTDSEEILCADRYFAGEEVIHFLVEIYLDYVVTLTTMPIF